MLIWTPKKILNLLYSHRNNIDALCVCVCVCVCACWRASGAVSRCTDRVLSVSRFNRALTTQEVTHSRNYISFRLPYDIVPKPLMEQKLVRSVPPIKQGFPSIQDIKQSFPSAYGVHLIWGMPFHCMLKSVGCIIRHIANVCGWTCTNTSTGTSTGTSTSTEAEYRFFLALAF